jgi:hypothetical protein
MFISTQISLELRIRLAYGSPLNGSRNYCSYISIIAYDSVLSGTQIYCTDINKHVLDRAKIPFKHVL